MNVSLVKKFPTFSLDDPRQLGPSLGQPWSPDDQEPRQSLSIHDWFPTPPPPQTIAVLVRSPLAPKEAPQELPFTVLTHFASDTTASGVGSSKPRIAAPTVVSAYPSQSVRELKRAILQADDRVVVEALVDSVVVWAVQMSREEMVIIGERGGLKNGRMPWP